MKKKFDKEDLFHLYHSSDLNEKDLNTILQEDIYSNKKDWGTFLEILFLVLGTGLFVSGVLFFFAYNWAELHAFAKFGTILFLLSVSVGCSIYSKFTLLHRRIALLSSSVLIGVLYAVFGQAYQTGANAYDFFLAWLLSIAIWTVTSKFPFQWLFFGILANTTLMLLFSQVFDSESAFTYLTGLIFLNIVLYAVPNGLQYLRKNITVSEWYNKFFIAVVSSISTLTICTAIFSNEFYRGNDSSANMLLSLCFSIGWLGLLLWRAITTKHFYAFCTASITGFFILLALLVRVFEFTIFSTLLYAMYLIGGTFGVVSYLMTTFKKWRHE